MSYLNIKDFRDFEFDATRRTFTGTVDPIHNSALQLANSTGVEADIWLGTGNLSWLSAATPLSIVSSAITDTSAGAGARTIIISGLDFSLNPISESVTLSGTTPAITINSYFRLQRAYINLCGTYSGTNLGIITIQAVSDSTVQGTIPIGFGRMAKSHYTVPAGKKLLLRSISMISESSKPSTFKLYLKGALPSTGGSYIAKQLGLVFAGVTGAYTENIAYEPNLGAGIDLWGTVTPSANNTAISINYQALVVTA